MRISDWSSDVCSSDLARALLAALAALALIVTPALAMRVSPMVVEMESRGTNAVARIEVQNINPGNLAFETRVFRMERSEEHTSELQSLMRISYADISLQKKNKLHNQNTYHKEQNVHNDTCIR